jgi:hypothetical protein
MLKTPSRGRAGAARVLFLAAGAALAGPAFAQTAGTPGDSTAAPPASFERRVYETRMTDTPPVLDGRLDDSCWDLVPWAEEFVMWEPEVGKPPTQPTAFKILYDRHALYVAYRAYDNDPKSIANRLARRDWFPGDWVEINIDSRRDGRTGYSFTASVSGTRGDEFISNDGDSWDGSWDPIWDLKTQIDEHGWTAEARIPLSQLRFSSHPEQTWGIQVQRRLFRHEERSLWQPKGREDIGWVSRFGELRGLRELGSPRRLELFPYMVARTERFEPEAGNPFADGDRSKLTGGVDGKTAVTGDLTLDFTINPDFGQVEADPSEVNLTAFETFFEEKRPFFIEGKNILDFRLAPAVTGGTFTQDNLFYSRRIGRQPGHFPDLDGGEYADAPENSSILGALKLTGKTPGGLSIGILESATAREMAQVAAPDGNREETVEPFTNYLIARAQQDFGQGTSQVGGMMTAVHRNIDDDHLDFLHSSAWAGGVDVTHRWKDRAWYVALNGLASRVSGDPAAILRTQRASARYFQRPDNDYRDVDSTATSLTGYSGALRFGRSAGRGFRFQTGVATRSPEFEINDLGFLRRSDEINQFTWAGYSIRDPFAIFRTAEFNANQWLYWDYGGTRLLQQANTNSNFFLKNNWRFGIGITRVFHSVSNSELRGGPSLELPGATELNFWVNGDQRKRIRVDFGGYSFNAADDHVKEHEFWGGPVLEPSNALRISSNLSFNRSIRNLQYIRTASFDGSPRYLFGDIDQKTLSLTFRIDYTITPNLTVQYYGAPFISSGKYP